MEDEVEKTKYKRLLSLRNQLMRNLAKQGCSSEAIALLFSLSKSHINTLVKDCLLTNPVIYSTEALLKVRENAIKKLKQDNYSDDDISVIFFKGSLEKAEEATSEIDLKEQNSALLIENKKLSNDLTSYKLAFKELSEQKAKLESENKSLLDKVNLSEQKYSSLDSDLIVEQINNKKLKNEITSLKSELENLQSLKIKNAELSEANKELKNEVENLDLDLQDSYKDSRDLKILNQNLMNENAELQSRSTSILYMQAELSEKLNTIQSLNSEINFLKSELESLTTDMHEKVSSKYERVYTDEQIQEMIEIYFRNHCKRKQSLEATRAALNINISDKHFVRLLQEAGVFKSTYRKRKK